MRTVETLILALLGVAVISLLLDSRNTTGIINSLSTGGATLLGAATGRGTSIVR